MHPVFSDDEFSQRLNKLRGRLEEAQVQLGLFDEIEAMTWLSGYGNSENRWRCVGIPLREEPFFLIRSLDAEPCRERTWISDVVSYRDWENAMVPLSDLLNKRGLANARVGLDFHSYGMPLDRFEAMRAALPNATFVDLGPVVWELRLIKSTAEQKLLRRAAKIANEAIDRAARLCVRGGTHRQVSAEAVKTFVERGAEVMNPGPIASGRGSHFLHGHMGEDALSEGEIVHIEVVPRVDGYSARLMRCVSVGRPSESLLHASETIRDIQDKQIAAMHPGAMASDVDAVLRKGLIESGLRGDYDNITGYTLGLYSPAGPRTSDFTRIFHPLADWRLETGQVFHMYASAAGVSLSETVLITDHGPEVLTDLPRTLYWTE